MSIVDVSQSFKNPQDNIRESSINLNTGLIRLMGKDGKERYVQINNTSILEMLKRYYDENRQTIRKEDFSLLIVGKADI